MDWFAIYTKPRSEGQTADTLQKAGIETLSPRIRITKFRRRRLVESVEPLFPCYIFARFDLGRHLHGISFTRGVRYVVWKGNPIVVPEGVIGAIKDNTRDGVVVPIVQNLKEGDRVRIRDGALGGFRGIFARELNGSERVAVLLDALGFRVEVDRHAIEKA